jgi:trehalose 6-phosphate synthase
MLGNDLLGFHLRYHCSNFLDTADRNVEALVDTEHSTIRRDGHTTWIRPFPISIDFESHSTRAQQADIEEEMVAWRKRLGPYRHLAIGIDRVDYTKGIPERLRAIDVLLERHPDLVGEFVMAQIGVPSRTAIGDYERLNCETLKLVAEINTKWRRGSWEPIHFLHQHVEMPSMMALHRLASCCVVTSLHDGMNLVAKEFVSSRFDEEGTLILSSFTGSARELTSALLINPYSPDEIASAIYTSLTMSSEERQERMRRLRSAVQNNNIYRWAGKILQELQRIESRMRQAAAAAFSAVIGAA